MKKPNPFAAKKSGAAPKADPKKKGMTPEQMAMARKKSVKDAWPPAKEQGPFVVPINTSPPGYICREGDLGMLAFEENYPGYSMTSITWQPSADFDGKGGSLEVPSELLHLIAKAYVEYLKDKNESRKVKIEPLPERSPPA